MGQLSSTTSDHLTFSGLHEPDWECHGVTCRNSPQTMPERKWSTNTPAPSVLGVCLSCFPESPYRLDLWLPATAAGIVATLYVLPSLYHPPPLFLELPRLTRMFQSHLLGDSKLSQQANTSEPSLVPSPAPSTYDLIYSLQQPQKWVRLLTPISKARRLRHREAG